VGIVTNIVITLATWVKIRYDIPVVVKQNMEIKIGKKIYVLRMSEEEVTDTPTPDDAPGNTALKL
jgi:hypothetical protein